MKKKSADETASFDDCLGCFGNFSLRNSMCKDFCALNLRCAIERAQNEQLEILEDMIYADGIEFML